MKVLTILLAMAFTQAAFAGLNEEQRALEAASHDALIYLASEGQVRGAHLDSAIQKLREHNPNMTTRQDSELAEIIIHMNEINSNTTQESQQ